LHPNDELAKKRHNSFGKTEMWYVMDANPGAELIVGFNKNVTKSEYSKSLEDNTLLDLLNYESLDAIDYEKKDDFKVAYDGTEDTANVMVDCPYFKTNFLNLQHNFTQNTTNRDSFTIFMCVDGEGVVETEAGAASIKKGETVLIPASSNSIAITTSGAKFLEVTI